MTFCAKFLFAQDDPAKSHGSIRGTISDTDTTIRMKNSSIVVIHAEDSILAKFTYAEKDGFFRIDHLPKGKFVLLISYPGYADYVQEFALDSAEQVYDFGLIRIIPKAKLLKEVIVSGRINTIRLKGDTTEYNVRNLKLQPNAKVEDLLKQLPGIQVDHEGKITAQGQSVNKVLVDGEEFFGDDPTLVTKNIRADMVDKVQVYDKKTDQAILTGIEDGKKEKTINIKIKEDMKNGYFGKLEGGAGTEGYYSGQVLFNSFKAKRKFSIYGLTGNDGKTGLGWLDNAKYASSNVEMTEPGVIVDLGGGDELETFDGRYNGQGIPLTKNGGIHYDNKWNDDKLAMNANYKIGSLSVDGASNTLAQNNLPGAIVIKNSNGTFRNYIFRQKLDATWQIKLDSTSSLKLMFDGAVRKPQTDNRFTSESKNGENALLNNETRTINNDGDHKLLNARLFYEKKFRKPGRSLSLNMLQLLNDKDITGYLNSSINFFDKQGGVDSMQLIDQYKISNTNNSEFHTNATYSESLSKTFAVILNYGLGTGNNLSDKKSFNRAPGDKYDILDSSLSNSFRLKQFYNQFGTFFNYNKGRMILNFGTKLSLVRFQQINKYTQDVFKRNFSNWYPQAGWQYQFSEQAFLKINYQGSTIMPTVDQLQPVLINNDPLNIIAGNPGLKPSFTNQFYTAYQSFNPVSGQLIGVFGNYSLAANPIVTSQNTDSAGKTISQAVNLPYKNLSHLNLSVFYDRKIKWLSMDAGINFTADCNTFYNISNSAINRIRFNTYSAQLRGSKAVERKYNFNFSLGPSYTIGESSLEPEINNNGKGFVANGGFTIFMPWKFQLAATVNYQYNEKTRAFNQDFSRALINASISKTFLKSESLRLSLTGNDLLNQNAGFERNVTGYMIIQNNYTTIRRYFMLLLTYDFSKMNKAEGEK